MLNPRGSSAAGLRALPLGIVLTTGAVLVAGVLTLIPWLATGDVAGLRLFFDGPGALFLGGLPVIEFLLCLLVVSSFSRGEPLRPAWILIVSAAACHATGGLLAHILGTRSLVNPLMWGGTAGPALLGLLRRSGQAIGGPFEMALLGMGLFAALRLYRESGVWARLKRLDWFLVAIVSAFTVCQLYQVAIAVRSGKRMDILDAIDLANDPMLCILVIEAILLHRSAVSMGRGLIARCWAAFATAVFLTSLGNMGSWATNYGYLPWPYASITWYVWFPATAAYALGPAYQVAALRHVARVKPFEHAQAGDSLHRGLRHVSD
jgi:hypothetical protein